MSIKTKPFIFLTLLLGCTYFAANARQTKGTHQQQATHDAHWALKQIKALPEVKAFLATTPSEYQPDIMLSGEPDKNFKYYWIKVGISNNDMFRTNFDLYIDPKTSRIFYWDQLCEDEARYLITLQQWRYWRTKQAWKKPHTYKNGKLIALKN